MDSIIKIGLLSDTHGWVHPSLFEYFKECDEIWHAGDIGDRSVLDSLREFKPLRAVYGNIDDAALRRELSETLRFNVASLDVLMTHIGGYPGRYSPSIREELYANPPKLFISGHSHIARVMPDRNLDLLHINPGAAGYNGFHSIMTAVRFTISSGKLTDLEMIELGERGRVDGLIRNH